jgi:hypothetical protein
VSSFAWEKHRAHALYERIEQYINRDRLRRPLGQAIGGIKSCHELAKQDAPAFWAEFFAGAARKDDAVAEVLRLLGELSSYMTSLGGVIGGLHRNGKLTMGYSCENYAGRSGINMPELLKIEELLLDKKKPVRKRQEAIVSIASTCQQNRVKRGLDLTAKGTRIIQQLTVVFKVAAAN